MASDYQGSNLPPIRTTEIPEEMYKPNCFMLLAILSETLL